jgi:hypothetical protein
MTNAQWFLLVGSLLLARGLTAPLLQRLPVTPAIVYLAVGLLVGPTVLNLFHFNPLQESALLEMLTEVVVLISPISCLACHWARGSCWAPSWHPPIRCWRPMSRPVIPVTAISFASP